jgi:4-cresol dehydrogenase (hydroxylating)
MFNQSNFGIVTKMTLWSSPAPEGFMSCHVAVPEEKDLEVFIDTFRGLLLDNTIQNHPVIGNVPRELGKRGPRKKWWPNGEGMIPDERMRELQKELNLNGWWDANFGLYGPKEIIEVNYKRCVDAFAKIPGSKIRGNPYYPKEGQKYLAADAVPYADTWMQTGVPSMSPICSIQYRGNDG